MNIIGRVLDVYIYGCVPFKNNIEKKYLYRKLKREFEGKIKIIAENKVLTYSGEVNRSEIYF